MTAPVFERDLHYSLYCFIKEIFRVSVEFLYTESKKYCNDSNDYTKSCL